MSLLTPDAGLLFWMLLSFGVVFFILAKYGFPVIVRMVEERRAFIQNSLDDANAAKAQLENFKAESDAIIATAREEQVKILHEANVIKESILSNAQQEAKALTAKQIDAVRKEIDKEREAAIKKIRAQVASLSVDIAEKVVRKELSRNEAHMELIDKYLEESKDLRS